MGFLPFGGYLAWQDENRPLWKITLAGAAFSLSIEIAQYVLGVGAACTSDLVTNTLGAFLGGWMVKKWRKNDAKRKT